MPGILDGVISSAPLFSRVMGVGVCMGEDRIRPSMAINKEIDLRFVVGYTPLEFRDTLHMLAEGKIDAAPLLTGVVGLAGVAAAFDALARPDEHAKILIDPKSPAAEPAPRTRAPMTEPQTANRHPSRPGPQPVRPQRSAARDRRGRPLHDLPDSLVHMLRASVERDPEARAIARWAARRSPTRELWDRAARVAGGLRAAGLERGDRAAILLPNGVDWVLAFWGAQLAGVVAVPVNTRFKEPEVEYVVNDSGARHVFRPGEALPDGEPVVVEDLAPDDLAAIFYTSGTTGFPKGAMTSHANFLANIENAVRCVGIDRAEGPELATLINVPLFHVTGCNSQLLVMAALGGRAFILADALDLDGFLDTVSRGADPDADLGARRSTTRSRATHALRRPISATCAGSPTAARRSPPAPCTRSWRRSPAPGWATASASPRPRR